MMMCLYSIACNKGPMCVQFFKKGEGIYYMKVLSLNKMILHKIMLFQ